MKMVIWFSIDLFQLRNNGLVRDTFEVAGELRLRTSLLFYIYIRRLQVVEGLLEKRRSFCIELVFRVLTLPIPNSQTLLWSNLVFTFWYLVLTGIFPELFM